MGRIYTQPQHWSQLSRDYPEPALLLSGDHLYNWSQTYTLGSSTTFGVGPHGKEIKVNGEIDGGLSIGVVQPVGDTYTVIILSAVAASSDPGVIYSQRSSIFGSPGINLSCNMDASFAGSSGRLSVACQNSAGDIFGVHTTSTSVVDGKYHVYAISRKSSSDWQRVWVDGIEASLTTTGSVASHIDSLQETVIGGVGSLSIAGYVPVGAFPFCEVWDKELTPEQIVELSKTLQSVWGAFKTPSRRIWLGAAAGGAQTLTPTLYSNAQTFYAPTVAAGAVTLTAGLFSNSNTFYGHTLTTTYGLVASLFTNSPSFYAPTVSVGSVTLAPTLFSNAATFYAHTVSQGAAPQELTPTLYSSSQTFYAPTVTAGSVALTATRLDNAQSFYVPVVTISGGPQYLVPGLYSESQTFYSPSVVPGSVTLTATRFDNAESFYAHTVSQSSSEQTLVPGLFIDSQTFYAHTLTGGVATLIPSLYSNDQEFYSATVVNVGVFVIPTARSTQQNIFSKRRTTSSRRLPNT